MGGGAGNNWIFDELFPQLPGLASCCDPFSQDCPADQKCVPYGEAGGTWSGSKCVDIEGSGQAGDACTSGGITGANDDCAAGLTCFFTELQVLNLVGTCTPLCAGSSADPICPPNTACVVANDEAVAVCLPTCDPLLQDCGQGTACHYAHERFTCLASTQDVPTGEPCSFSNNCAAGNACLPAALFPSCNGDFCCASFCDLGSPACAVMGTECVAFYAEGQAPAGYENVGVCTQP
ncbi:ribulose phosphate epimerase [Nannocystaceae bacterium ST9]